MAEFDLETWKQRAWDRYCRSVRAGGDDSKLGREWALEVVAVTDMQQLVSWCSDRGIKVNFVKKPNGTYLSSEKSIEIAARLSPRNAVIVLLHECGHHLIGFSEHDRYAMGYSQIDPNVKKTFDHRLACLDEEMEAWHRGWRLSKRLDLNVDKEDYDTYKVKCLRSYVKWTLKPGKFENENED